MSERAPTAGALDPSAVLAQAPVPLLVLEGPELRLAIANDALRQLLAYDGPLGVPARAVLPAETIRQATHVLASGAPARLGETVVVTSAGERCYRATLQPLRDPTGALVGVMAAYEDVTEDAQIRRAQRQACAAAEHASARKDRFIATMSHELRAPLMTLLLWENLLRSGGLAGPDRERALDAIEHSAATLSQLIRDLQDLARAISGTLPLDVHVIELAPLLRDVADRFAPRARDRELALATELAPELGTLAASPDRLRQVLDALLRHAASATPPGGLITLTAQRDGDQLVITVRDTGRGIRPDRRPFVFEPFSRQGDELTTPATGLGLELALASALVQLHSGTLAADSAGEGAGATFTITLSRTGAVDSQRR